MLDIKKIIAGFLDPLKVKNPILFAIIGVMLLVLQYALMQGNFYGLFPIDGNISTALQWLNFAIAIVVSPRTSQILGGDNVPQLKADLMKASVNLDTLSQYNDHLNAEKTQLAEHHENLQLQNEALQNSFANLQENYQTLTDRENNLVEPFIETPPKRAAGRPQKK